MMAMRPRFTIASLFAATAYSAVFVAAYRHSTFISFWLAFVAALSLIYFPIRTGLRSSGPVRTLLFTFAAIASLALIRPLLARFPFLGTWMVGSMISVDGIFTWTAAAHLGALLMLEWLVGAVMAAGLAAGAHRFLILLRK